MNLSDLVGVAEIAQMAGVTKQVVSNWRRRYDTFPKPIKILESGPVWTREALEAWTKPHRGEATHVISFINLKGGVGKTTTAVAVAEILAQEHSKRVLVVDLDPQTNASVTLISEEKWKEMDDAGQTLAQLFADKLNPQSKPIFNLERSIVRSVSTINDGIAKLELLPSSIKLIALQDRIPQIAMWDDCGERPIDILKNTLEPLLDAYDYVIIDCPPSLGAVTRNGLRISTGYVIPAIPDILSTWGIYQIVDSVEKLAGSLGISIPALGIVATKKRENNLHRRVIDDLQNGRLGNFAQGKFPQPKLFNAIIRETVDAARGMDFDAGKRTFKQKYGSAFEDLQALTKEIMHLCQPKNS